MIKKIILENYCSFGNVEIDFSKTKNQIKNKSFIYGENGAGKSNIINAIIFLKSTLHTLLHQETLNEFIEKGDFSKHNDFILDFLKSRHFFLEHEIERNKMIDSTTNMTLEFHLSIQKKDAVYKMEFSNDRIVSEELNYVIEKNSSCYFKINMANDNIFLNGKVFFDTKYKEELNNKISKLFGRHTFLSIITYEIENNNKSFIKKAISSKLLSIINEIENWYVCCKKTDLVDADLPYTKKMLINLEEGTINEGKRDILLNTEKALNTFFSSIFSDIKAVKYLKKNENKKIKYELVFEKVLNNEIRKIPYDYESTGTISLLRIFPYLYGFANGRTVFIDEIDSGIHDLLMNYIITSLPNEKNGQLVATTHNTLLMQSVNPDSLYVINVDVEGKKKIECLTDIARIQKNNNVTKNYLNGAFGGVPVPGYLDFEEIKKCFGE